MEIWLAAFYNVFSPMPLLFIFGGVMMGVMLGAIPGLNSTMGTALLIPFTYAMDSTTGLLLLTAVYCGGTFGGSISAILFNVPGSPEASVTGFDGYPMAKAGQAGRALGIAIMCSTIGGLFSVVVMNLISPLLAEVALTFSDPEYFALAFAALTLIATLGGKQMTKSFLIGFVGLLIATVGIDPMAGVERFTFGWSGLIGGVNFIVALIGAFAVGEILLTAESGSSFGGEGDVKVSTKLPSSVRTAEASLDDFALRGARHDDWHTSRCRCDNGFVHRLFGSGSLVEAPGKIRHRCARRYRRPGDRQ